MVCHNAKPHAKNLNYKNWFLNMLKYHKIINLNNKNRLVDKGILLNHADNFAKVHFHFFFKSYRFPLFNIPWHKFEPSEIIKIHEN